jgi:hypothetical protein
MSNAVMKQRPVFPSGSAGILMWVPGRCCARCRVKYRLHEKSQDP